jgi:hypothetical protein
MHAPRRQQHKTHNNPTTPQIAPKQPKRIPPCPKQHPPNTNSLHPLPHSPNNKHSLFPQTPPCHSQSLLLAAVSQHPGCVTSPCQHPPLLAGRLLAAAAAQMHTHTHSTEHTRSSPLRLHSRQTKTSQQGLACRHPATQTGCIPWGCIRSVCLQRPTRSVCLQQPT